MTNYKRYLVKLRKAKSNFFHLFNKRSGVPDIEKKILQIVKHIINDESSQLVIAPITNAYYAKASNKNVLVIIDTSGNCNILNSVCNYYITLSRNTLEEITSAFRQKMEARADSFKTEYLKSRDENLQSIINTL